MTGAKPVLLGPSAGSASFMEICTPGVKNFWLARATPHPAIPSKRIIAPARIFDLPPNLCKFMVSPYPHCDISSAWLNVASLCSPYKTDDSAVGLASIRHCETFSEMAASCGVGRVALASACGLSVIYKD